MTSPIHVSRSGVGGTDEQEVQEMLKRIVIPPMQSPDSTSTASRGVHHYHIGDAVEIEYGLAGGGSDFKATIVAIGVVWQLRLFWGPFSMEVLP